MKEVGLGVLLVGKVNLVGLSLLILVFEEVSGEEEVVLERLRDIVVIDTLAIIFFIFEHPMVLQ